MRRRQVRRRGRIRRNRGPFANFLRLHSVPAYWPWARCLLRSFCLRILSAVSSMDRIGDVLLISV